MSAKEGGTQLREEDVEVVTMFVVLNELYLFEPQVTEVATLHFVTLVVKASSRGDEVLLFERVSRRNVKIPNRLFVLLVRISSLQLNFFCFVSC